MGQFAALSISQDMWVQTKQKAGIHVGSCQNNAYLLSILSCDWLHFRIH